MGRRFYRSIRMPFGSDHVPGNKKLFHMLRKMFGVLYSGLEWLLFHVMCIFIILFVLSLCVSYRQFEVFLMALYSVIAWLFLFCIRKLVESRIKIPHQRNWLTLVSFSGWSRFARHYDASGNRTKIIWPDAVEAVYAYDAGNRLNTVSFAGLQLDVLWRRCSPECL